jgi:hypothetical protein
MGAKKPTITAKCVLKSIAPTGRSYGRFPPLIKPQTNSWQVGRQKHFPSSLKIFTAA